MNRCSFCEWIPILPLPVWPLAGQFLLGQNVVVGSMTLLLALRGNIATKSMSGHPFALQLHRTTVWCGATGESAHGRNALYNTMSSTVTIYYPFHPHAARTLPVVSSPRHANGSYTVKDLAGSTLKVPVWMTES